jgi:hypothetical protein
MTGDPSPFRRWLLPVALFALVAVAWWGWQQSRPHRGAATPAAAPAPHDPPPSPPSDSTGGAPGPRDGRVYLVG